MSAPGGELLLTGATGFVGMEVLARYLERGERRILALIRAPNDDLAGRRLDLVLENLFGDRGRGYRPRIEAVASELTAPRMGLSPRRRRELAERTGTIVHSAASVAFDMPLSCAREINVAGTREMLDLAELAAEHGGLERYTHLSTAYVAGTHSGRFRERDHDLAQGFHNSYEQSKFEAERLVRERSGLPFTIVRPSIVVGDRRSGWTAAFNVIYWPLRALARGLLEVVPAVPSAPVDVVSIDYVADAVYELSERVGALGATYHLTAGANASSIGEVAALASRYFRRPAPELLSPAAFDSSERGALSRQVLEQAQVYFPYFSLEAVFDDRDAHAVLSPRGIDCSPLSEYLGRLLDFATASRWGKHLIPRVDALKLAVSA